MQLRDLGRWSLLACGYTLTAIVYAALALGAVGLVVTGIQGVCDFLSTALPG